MIDTSCFPPARRCRTRSATIVAVAVAVVFGGGVLRSLTTDGRDSAADSGGTRAAELTHADVAPTGRADAATGTLSSLDADTRHGILDAMRVGQQTDDGRGIVFRDRGQHLAATITADAATIIGLGGARVSFADPSVGRRAWPGNDVTPGVTLALSAAGSVAGLGTARATIARAGGALAVTEWWNNTSDGIEQGFTIGTRPDGEGPLVLEQTVTTDLAMRASDDGSAVAWHEAGQERLRFEHVRAWDRTGRVLPAHLEARDDRLAMVVDDAGARYPVTIDPTWTQQAYLKASNTDAGDVFGGSVAVSGDTIVVGAAGESSQDQGVNGSQSDNSYASAGAAYVFVRNGTTWTQQAYLKASNTDPSDQFGGAVAVSGDTVVVGAASEDSNATGVNGTQSDDSASAAGAAYVFVRTGTTWTQQAYLKASNTDAGDVFGQTVAISGDTVVVGANGEDSNASGVNGVQGDNSADGSGAAYVFVRASTAWTQQAYLKASSSDATDAFGAEVGISGDTVIVGAPNEASNATGVNGNAFDDSLIQAGAAYVFVRTGTTWTQEAYLKASNTGANDFFGQAVALSGDRAVVGAQGERSNATGVNGDQTNNSALSAGAAYAFVRTGTTWAQQAYLKASNTDAQDFFGSAVAVSGDTIVVGAIFEESNATGVNGDETNNSFGLAGAAYVFEWTGAAWMQQAYLKASNTDASDYFSWALAMSGDTVIVGAAGEDSQHTGVNAAQGDNSAETAGAAYIFRLNAVSNGTFSGGTTNWQFYATPDLSYIVPSVSGGVLEFYRQPPPPGTSNQAVAFQQTGQAVASDAAVMATFDLGNSSTVRKRIAVLLHDSSFLDLAVCTFWLPPGSPLQEYAMRTHSTQAWTNATISFYAATTGSDGGAYQIDNVILTREPTQSVTRTDCVDALAPTPPGGPDGPTLLTNGDFGTGMLAPWVTFGTITSQIVGNVFEFIRPTATPPAGVILQATGATTTADEILTATFELGNSSSVRKRVTVLLHDLDFSDLTACTWWLAPGAPLGKHEIRTYVSEGSGWSNATLSIYAATVGADQWIRLDNATLQRTPGGAALGTECFEPGDPTAPLLVAGDASSVVRSGVNSVAAPAATEAPATMGDDAGVWQAVADFDGIQTLDGLGAIDLRGVSAATLELESWLSAGRSTAAVQVSVDSVSWQTIGEVPPSENWTPLAVDLTDFAGQVIRVRFVFDARASGAGAIPDRWLVRDIRLSVGAPGR